MSEVATAVPAVSSPTSSVQNLLNYFSPFHQAPVVNSGVGRSKKKNDQSRRRIASVAKE